jgi:acetyltransferase-like isoleucine patch superfamily enzyme
MLKSTIQKLFNLRTDVGLNFYIIGFIFKYIFRQNADVPWMTHHTSTVKIPQNIHVGIDVFPGDSPNNYIEALNGLFIGDFTNIGPNVSIITANYQLENNKAVVIDNIPVKIGKFCWLGTNAVILPRVQIGDFTVVAAGAVVTKSFSEGYVVLAGNPAVVIKTLSKKDCEQTEIEKYINYNKISRKNKR